MKARLGSRPLPSLWQPQDVKLGREKGENAEAVDVFVYQTQYAA